MVNMTSSDSISKADSIQTGESNLEELPAYCLALGFLYMVAAYFYMAEVDLAATKVETAHTTTMTRISK